MNTEEVDTQIKEFMKKHGIRSIEMQEGVPPFHDGVDFSGNIVKIPKQTISEKIKELEASLSQVKGRETEKYARIVGYYRAVKNWNKGKKAEWKQRINFTEESFHNKEPKQLALSEEIIAKPVESITATFDHYILFYRPTCPNCPVMKKAVKELELKGKVINAERAITLTMAQNVYAVPTVIFYNKDDTEIVRATNVGDLKNIISVYNVEQVVIN